MKHHESDCCTAIMVFRVPVIKITKLRQMSSALYPHSIHFDISALLSNNLFEWPACILQLISVKYFPPMLQSELRQLKSIKSLLWFSPHWDHTDESKAIWIDRCLTVLSHFDYDAENKTKQSIRTLQGNISRCISSMVLLCNEILIAKCIIDDIVRVWEHVCMRVGMLICASGYTDHVRYWEGEKLTSPVFYLHCCTFHMFLELHCHTWDILSKNHHVNSDLGDGRYWDVWVDSCY